jgi:rhodanese-related sulfurtransferase
MFMKGERVSTGREFTVVLLTAVFASLVYNAFSGTGLPLIREAPPKVVVSDEEIFGAPAPAALSGETDSAEPGPFRVITLGQMRKILDGKSGLIADARTPEEYAAGHIAGSVNLYAMEPENYVERIADLPRDTLVVVYCSNPHCPFARTVAGLLGTFGFTNVLLYDEGYDGWTDAGLPVVSGADDR